MRSLQKGEHMEEEIQPLRADFYVRADKNEIAFSVEGLADRTPLEIADFLERIAYVLRMWPQVPISALNPGEPEFVRRYMEREMRRQEYPIVRPIPKE
jgi:hypothetical protein